MLEKIPADLTVGGRGRALWAAILADYEPGVDELVLLADLARTIDLVDELARRVAEDGPVDADGRVSPLVVELRQQRTLVRQLLRQLNLPDVEGETWSSVRARSAATARWS